MILWRESWLRKVENTGDPINNRCRSHCTITLPPQNLCRALRRYYCQASELSKATDLSPVAPAKRLQRYCAGLERGKLHRAADGTGPLAYGCSGEFGGCFLGVYPHEERQVHLTTEDSLSLQPGEWVEVKSIKSISGNLE